MILQGAVEGRRRTGRPKKRWIDNLGVDRQIIRRDSRHDDAPPTAPRGAKGPRRGKAQMRLLLTNMCKEIRE